VSKPETTADHIAGVGEMVTQQTTPDQGWWSIRQNGIRVCGGFGSYASCQREAAHYAAMYAEEGPVKVIVRRNPRRKERANVG
jgi:hypothetical protein